MTIEFIVAFACTLFVLSLIGEPIARLLRVPHSVVLVLTGAIVAYVVTSVVGVDTGLRAGNFQELIFFVFLPVLIFEAATKIPLRRLRENLGAILFLAIVGMLLTTVITASMLYWGIGHAVGFPWIAALLAGALLAATDPVAVVAQLKTLGAPERLEVLLEGESLFNDATAIVAFGIFLTLALMPEADVTLSGATVDFFVTFIGGAVVGLGFGFAGVLALRAMGNHIGVASVTLTAAYGSFLLAESVLHVSGVMGSLVAGLLLARSLESRSNRQSVDFLWSELAYLANGCVFLLMGVTITLDMFRERWLAMLIAIAGVLIARSISTIGGLALLNPFLANRVPASYQVAMVWGGLRGAVTLALALSLPTELEYWWTIQSMAFGVVLFTMLIQAPTTPLLLRRTNLVK